MRTIAEAAARELLTSVRELEGRQLLASKLQQSASAQATLGEIAAVVAEIGNADASHRQRLVALSRLAKAITTSAAEHSLVAMDALSRTRGLATVRAFCDAAPPDDVHVLGSGLALFANVCLQG